MRPHARQADEQVRLTVYRHIIDRYLRYILIRCTAYTNDKTQTARITLYALVTACLLYDKLCHSGQLSLLIETMINIVADDQLASCVLDAADPTPVFVLDDRTCEVAGAINGLERFERELLILHHIEGIDIAALADMHRMSPTRITKRVAEAERELMELLRGMSSWNHEIDPDVHALLIEFADCLQVLWAKNLGVFALRYLAEHGW